MSVDLTAILVALAHENADLRRQLASAQDMLIETAIDAGNLHALIEATRTECDAWRAEAARLERQGTPPARADRLLRAPGIGAAPLTDRRASQDASRPR